jgi:hypothetical protein
MATAISQDPNFNGFGPIQNDLIQETPSDKAQLLDELLLKNHTENALLHHGALHNHLPHVSSENILDTTLTKTGRDTLFSLFDGRLGRTPQSII